MTDELRAAVRTFWWLLILRGLLAIVFGFFVILWPRATLLAIIVLFAIYTIVDGISAVGYGLMSRRNNGSAVWTVVLGILGVVAGIVVLVWPAATALVILWVVAIWSVVMGLAAIATSLGLKAADHAGWGWVLLEGLLGLAFGIALMVWPTTTILSLLWLVAVWAFATGLTLIVLGFQLRSLTKELHEQPA